jgi:hypothetical protein
MIERAKRHPATPTTRGDLANRRFFQDDVLEKIGEVITMLFGFESRLWHDAHLTTKSTTFLDVRTKLLHTESKKFFCIHCFFVFMVAQLKTFVSTLARRSIIGQKQPRKRGFVSLDREFDSRADSVEFMDFN